MEIDKTDYKDPLHEQFFEVLIKTCFSGSVLAVFSFIIILIFMILFPENEVYIFDMILQPIALIGWVFMGILGLVFFAAVFIKKEKGSEDGNFD